MREWSHYTLVCAFAPSCELLSLLKVGEITNFFRLSTISSAFSKSFPGGGYKKVGGGLGSEGTHSSVLGCRPVVGFQSILPW